jgi:hypothetical protein
LAAACTLAANLDAMDPSVPGELPYAWSVAVFYLLNVLCLALAVHLLASAIENASRHPEVQATPAGCLRWWLLRLIPILICLPPLGHTLVRGQANVILLLLVCGFIAALMRGRRLQAGFWLAGAICIKIFPAYLLVVPLTRRDCRCLAGCAAGLILGLGVIPLLALGSKQTVVCYRELAEVLVGPALNVGDDGSRAKELIEATATDNQSFLVTIHNTRHLDRRTRPDVASSGERKAHLALAAFFTGLTLVAGWRHRRDQRLSLPLFVGGLTVIMILSSPVCHSHYFLLALPLVMGLLAAAWEQDRVTKLSWTLTAFMTCLVLGPGLQLVPAFEILKDLGIGMYAVMALWLSGCLLLWWMPNKKDSPLLQPAIWPEPINRVA